MNKDNFNRWKEDNQWLLKAFQRRAEQVDQEVSDLAKNVLVCPIEELESKRFHAAGMSGIATTYAELSEMTFDFYQELMGEET